MESSSSSTTSKPILSTKTLSKGRKLIEAARIGSEEQVTKLIDEEDAQPFFQDPVNGISPLMAAAGGGYPKIVSKLLQYGVPWNALDKGGRCAGDYAIMGKHQEVIDQLIGAGVTAEIILRTMARQKKQRLKEEASKICNTSSSSSIPACSGDPALDKENYLSLNVKYEDDKLVDGRNRGVMMEWERPLMETHASILCSIEHSDESVIKDKGIDILNIGFGMGIIDSIIETYRGKTVNTHTIIEAHPQVQKKMIADGWDKKPGVKLVFGKWQDVLDQLGHYDSIFFDTFAEEYEDMYEFHQHLPNILRLGGKYSFFNGMCPGNFFFHAVACEMCKMELDAIGISAEFAPCKIECDPTIWEEVKIKYWSWDTYYIPLCTRDREV